MNKTTVINGMSKNLEDNISLQNIRIHMKHIVNLLDEKLKENKYLLSKYDDYGKRRFDTNV